MERSLWVVSTNKKYKRRRIVLILGVVVPLLCYAGFVFSQNLKTYNNLKAQRIIAEQEYEEAQQENEQLEQEVEFTKTDDYIVQKARELLGYVKPGEVKFVEENE